MKFRVYFGNPALPLLKLELFMGFSKNIKFKESKFLLIYIHELLRLANGIKNNCEKIFKEATIPSKGYSIQVSPDLHSYIIYVLINAANVKKLVFTTPNKLDCESEQTYEFRKE